ncbi:alpha/beta hydrolase [Undibacterium flavidum]|uniref:Lysophospholipase n=1 Tax=Undibacterium flavidum TaxID=2762297 RepID=A0ABR6YAD4_9BURK|nr:alpha/beta hydrolase [Undibacterium flavidum]MBC3873516.1 lysophospholipase [Undibacterium flavidum]
MTAHVEHTEEFFLEALDGASLFVRDWPVQDGSDAPGIVVMHGLGEHSGRYVHVARFFNALGFKVRSFDQRGHGQSSGARGDIPDTDAILRDTRLVITDFSKQLQKPPFVVAHSMGGLFATRFALEGLTPLSGLILSSPAFSVRTSRIEKFLFKISRVLIPHLGVGHGTNGRYLSHDSEVVAAYQNDPLVHARISASLFQSMLDAMQYVKAHATELKTPTLLLIADGDLVVNPQGAKNFSTKLNASSHRSCLKTQIYPGFYHEVFNELEALQVFEDVRIWLEENDFMPAARQ